MKTNLEYWLVIGLWILGLGVSGLHPKDRLTWYLEVFPVFMAIPVLLYTRTRFRFPRYIMFLICIHGIVLMIGAHYTYAEVPFGYWLKDLLDLDRNPFDRIGHLFQGFVPALITAEILRRKVGLRSAGWISFLSIAVCMAISVMYEFIEWWAAVLLGQDAEAFLGTQGDPWDTQWDMFTATLGAILAQGLYWRQACKV
jgi:putative membrane protein